VTPEFAGPLHVLGLTDRGVQCATSPDAAPFWLRRGGHVLWEREAEVGQAIHADVPGWLAQLVGDVAFDRVRHANTRKDHEMSEGSDQAGNGALFKNDKKAKPSHPDYRGDVTVRGRKFWISGWIKDGRNGKYMSLALREAEEPANGKPKPTSAQTADADMPF
jgi:hypothetical protein